MVIVALSIDIFHAFEEIFYDHQATIFTNSAFSRLTNKVILFAGIISLCSIPFYICGLIDENYKMPSWLSFLRYITSILLVLVFVLVIFVLFPATWIIDGLEEAAKVNFLGDCLFTHLLIPIIYVVTYCLLDPPIMAKKTGLITTYIIIGAYIIIYTLFCFVLKTWEDFYFINEVINRINIGIIGVFFVLAGLIYCINYLMFKIKRERT